MKSRNTVTAEIQGINKAALVRTLTDALPTLRATIGLSQENISNLIGISRQTYSSIETKKRSMPWNIYLALILVFDSNKKTHDLLKILNLFPEDLHRVLSTDERTSD